MIKQVLFVQGGGEGTHDTWDNKLVASLTQKLGAGHVVHYPRMPMEAEPDPTTWKKAIGDELRRIGDDAIVVGHSIGAAILLEAVAEPDLPARVAAVFLIATPYIGEGGWPLDDLRPTQTLAAALPAHTPVYVYQGDNDDTVAPAHADLLGKALPQAIVRRLRGRDHQLDDDLSEVAHDISRLG